MALPMLVNNADCGPSNALQGLSKRFDHDRGLQQDHFGPGRAGSSREVFRSQQSGSSSAAQEAARFFSSGPTPQLASGAFDLSALHGSLPVTPAPFQQQQQAPAPWAADFIQAQPVLVQKGSNINLQMEAQMQREMSLNAAAAPAQPQGGQQWNPMFSPFAQRPMQNFMPSMMMQPPQPSTQHDQIMWDREFSSQEIALAARVEEAPQIQEARQVAQDADELARTAGLLLETVRDAQAQNSKFQKSEFLGLMRGLRDRDIVVEGNDMVQNTGQASASAWASDFQADVKGKGRAMNPPLVFDPENARKSVSFATMASVRLAEQPVVQEQDEPVLDEDPNDAYFRQENVEYQHYWAEANARATQASTSQVPTTANAEWDRLQADWDSFEATSTGIRPVDRYIFQQNNPYVSDRPSLTTRHHLSHQARQPFLDSVLELEAAVQRNMRDASAWFDLGVKQQANEREKQALQALTRAVELDPSLLPAWLALAISHTNDGNRAATHDAVRNWVDRNERYADAVRPFRVAHLERADAPMPEKFGDLIQCLIAMARSDTSGEIDADIQIALAVLLNTNEDYEKAQDCFRTALAVRPDDWLLYNRVGATMANSGHAEEALQYYHRALELNPVYIRARFNLGISCINLRRFEEAAHHILDALGLQESDGVSYAGDGSASGAYGGDGNASGVTTTALWDSLRTASMHMQRPDLATFCDRQDLDGEFKN
ncbi:hypothetical protein DFH07DRAFT_163633 [Mycena maculata]|uniref:Peroxisomal targeting signal receptor n=1 Tax=Mycena maculata TaxID=230809 RepID=A0AAD7JVB5_9AGAR|nr:hypothetical protein DFH07DRAFT_163633 [Mycena maculata]